MPTDLDLANEALGLIGQDRVTTLSAGSNITLNNKVVPTINLYLPQIKHYTLQLRDWRCARRRAVPAIVGSGKALDNPSLGEWRFAYRLPADYLMMRRFVAERTWKRHKWQVEIDDQGKRILYTNFEKAKIVYTAYIDDVNMWDHVVYQLAVARLAMKLGISFSRDFKIAQGMFQHVLNEYDEAAGAETAYEQETGSNFVDARLGGPTAGDFFDVDPAGLESPLFP